MAHNAQQAQPDQPDDVLAGLAPHAEDELLRCNRCGFCMSTCPTYRSTLKELFVARGRNRLAQRLLRGDGLPPDDYAEPLFQCLLCGACTVTCRSSVKTDDVMVAARRLHWQKTGRSRALRLFFDRLLPNPRLLRRLVRLVGVGKRSGLSSLARSLGLLRWINARLETAEALVETMPSRFLRDRLHGLGFRRVGEAGGGGGDAAADEGAEPHWLWPRPEGTSGPRLLYFIGCGTDLQLPEAGEAAMRVLHSGGCDLVVVEHVCCGLPPYSYGDVDAARALAEHNLEALSRHDCDYLVADCGSCTSFLRRYGELLGERGEALAAKVRDFTEIAAGLELPGLPGPGASGDEVGPGQRLRVTYHDPCHLVRGQGITAEPRELLRRAGCELVELPEADWCCGGAGSYNIMHPELSLAVLERKMRNIAATGAPVVATACPSCMIQLRYGARRFGIEVEVLHVAQVVARAMDEVVAREREETAAPRP